MEKYKLFAGVYSDVGVSREINQDNYYFGNNVPENSAVPRSESLLYTDGGVFSVADGMGGESQGEFASAAAMKEMQILDQNENITKNDVIEAINHANSAICERMTLTKENIGTTIVTAVIKNNVVNIYNLGDSKCFLYDNSGKLIQLSKDHTLAAQMVHDNMMTPQQAQNDPRKHQLTQHLGIYPEDMLLSVFCQNQFTLKKDEMLILCSDGLTDGLSNEKITEILNRSKNGEYETLPKELAAEAIAGGSKDNITVMVIRSLWDTDKSLKNIIFILACFCSAALGAIIALLLLGLGM